MMCQETQALFRPFASTSVDPPVFHMYVEKALEDAFISVPTVSYAGQIFNQQQMYQPYEQRPLPWKPSSPPHRMVQKHERTMAIVSPAPFRPHTLRRHRTLLYLYQPKSNLQSQPPSFRQLKLHRSCLHQCKLLMLTLEHLSLELWLVRHTAMTFYQLFK